MPPLCRVVVPFHSVNLKERKQAVFLSSEPLERPVAMLVCLFFEPVGEGKNAPAHLFLCCKRLCSFRRCIYAPVCKNAPECSRMFFIFRAWRVALDRLLDVADAVYVAFLMHSAYMIPCAPPVGSDNLLVFGTEHLFWHGGFSGSVHMIRGGIFCYDYPQPVVCAVNAPGTLIPVAYRGLAYLFSDCPYSAPISRAILSIMRFIADSVIDMG